MHGDGEVKSPVVAEPVRLYDCCPFSDGAASVVLCNAAKASKFGDTSVIITGFVQANDTLRVYERADATTLRSLREASRQAFNMAKLEPDDIDAAGLRDALLKKGSHAIRGFASNVVAFVIEGGG